ncbi:MAG: NAD(P)-binding protein [Lachnospiraceae bacterium]|nr:NAD(P)-binding protein [Lachnospiraceae bacterium]
MKETIQTKYLIIGAGISGLAFATKLKDESFLIVEKEQEIGGYCKTFKQDGFTWDYAGHFFHFNNPEIQKQFSQLLQAPNTVYNDKNTKIYYKDSYVDYPFQFNIHQLDKDEFIECLCGLFDHPVETGTTGFKEMLYSKLGKGIADKFLIPYNEKLYSCDLNTLDEDAMGRFFPKADPVEIVKGFQGERLKTYNDEFFYSGDGAKAFVDALEDEIDSSKILTSETVTDIDYEKKIVYTSNKIIQYSKLINTMPFNQLLDAANIPHEENYTANKVLIFNLGFDSAPVDKDIHWIYYPDKSLVFYRVGFYNNILRQDRMSLYIEIGLNSNQTVDINEYKTRVLEDLKKVGIVTTHKLISDNSIMMDPAYVHISEKTQREKDRIKEKMAQKGIYTIGRYGNWTYCSIEDCIQQAYALFENLKHK